MINAADRCAPLPTPATPATRGQGAEKCQKGRAGGSVGVGHRLVAVLCSPVATPSPAPSLTGLVGRRRATPTYSGAVFPATSAGMGPSLRARSGIGSEAERDGINRALTAFPYVTGTPRSRTLSLSPPPVSLLSRLSRPRRGGGSENLPLWQACATGSEGRSE